VETSKKEKPGSLSMHRLNHCEDGKSIRVVLRDGRKQLADARLSLEHFSAALFGLSEVPCVYLVKPPAPEEVVPGAGTALYVVATMVRDAVNRFRVTGLQSDADELDRLTGLFNLPSHALVGSAIREVEREKATHLRVSKIEEASS
jgi:hypothetical protein